jgi:hypothetical protein
MNLLVAAEKTFGLSFPSDWLKMSSAIAGQQWDSEREVDIRPA